MTAGPFRTLGFVFSLDTDDHRLAHVVDELFASCRAPGEVAAHRFTATTAADDSSRLVLDEEVLLEHAPPSLVVPMIVWAVNQRAVRSVDASVLVHAGAVARGDRAILLVGPSGAGKTTLTAHLLLEGFDYLTDEAVPFDPTTGLVSPYPKPLKLEAGSFALVPGAAPPAATTDGHLDTWHVPPARLTARVRTAPAPATAVVAVRHVASGPTTLTLERRARMLVHLAEQSFNIETLGVTGFAGLHALTERCACANLATHELAPTAPLLDRLLAAPVTPPTDASFEIVDVWGTRRGHPRPRAGLAVARLDGEAAVFDGRAARVHHLDVTARAAWDACDGVADADAIAGALSRRFGADTATVRADLQVLLADLDAAGLLEPRD